MVVHHGLILVASLGLLQQLCFVYFPIVSDPVTFVRSVLFQQEAEGPHDTHSGTNLRLLAKKELVQSSFLSDHITALSDVDVDVELKARNQGSNKFRLLSESFIKRHRLREFDSKRIDT
jgi:hypothetical protein